jgi:hypothetical protein
MAEDYSKVTIIQIVTESQPNNREKDKFVPHPDKGCGARGAYRLSL